MTHGSLYFLVFFNAYSRTSSYMKWTLVIKTNPKIEFYSCDCVLYGVPDKYSCSHHSAEFSNFLRIKNWMCLNCATSQIQCVCTWYSWAFKANLQKHAGTLLFCAALDHLRIYCCLFPGQKLELTWISRRKTNAVVLRQNLH